MSLSKLVSEGEDSSDDASILASPQKPTYVSQLSSDQKIDNDKSESEEQPDQQEATVDKKEEDREDDEGEGSREGTPNIKNEMVKSKIPLNASIMLTRLPPDSNKVIAKLEEQTNEKITIRCVPIASAPEIRPNVFKISSHQPFSTLIKFITKKLKKRLNDKGVIYCYVNNSFVPSPDEIIGDLFRHFGSNNELTLSYSTVVAFG